MKNEQEFWEDVAGTINPGWSIRVNPGAGESGASLAGKETFVYVVDVASGWLGAGAIAASDIPKIISSCRDLLAKQDHIRIFGSADAADVAGKAIALCGEVQADAAAQEVSLAISMTVVALQDTQTYSLAAAENRERGEAAMAGHWIYLAFSTRTVTGIVTRPFWVSSMHPGIGRVGRFLDPADLRGLVRSVVSSETSSTQSTIGRHLAANGGAIVAPKLLD
jgi:hypothetical protein